MGFEKTNFPVSRATEAISLAKFIEERPQCFTEKTKRVLSLIIGCTVLHLHQTSWLQPGWGSVDIAFFQTTSNEVPLRPFIQTELHEDTLETHNDDVLDDDEMYMSHLCPFLIDLAIVLMEIHFVKSFRTLAEMRQIELLEKRNGRVAFVDTDQVFNGDRDEDDDSDCEQNGLKSEIPGDFRNLILAIENCLDAELWEDEHQNPLGPETLRSRIYEKVVRPLELHLVHGFSDIPLDGVDKFARNIDFSQWGKAMYSEKQVHSGHGGAEKYSKTPAPSTALSVQAFAKRVASTDFRSRISSTFSYTPGRQVVTSSSLSVGDAQGHFFDDEKGQISNNYDDWKRRYLSVYEKFIEKYIPSYLESPIRIAILDTGIDEDHVLLEAHRDIKGKHNFYDTSRKRRVTDTTGHGTFAANLILDYAPDADLYVIKVADDNTLPDAEVVQRAIGHAVDVWRVDIISMSFGWPTSNFPGHDGLRKSIDMAYSKQVLMFAAASNNGGNSGRAYPASSPHSASRSKYDELLNRGRVGSLGMAWY
ncbi:pfs domain-containing protein [Colletotrichum chrysophilum]|uniref:Pfs domain-containing protein n=1 Tax=Colletotrichum chrysophilum TaxID=1836956 RepID=A0AAD9E8S5_9PEZI|nr:pfs domain-containing protein [Colletotrichum chrysophilum]